MALSRLAQPRVWLETLSCPQGPLRRRFGADLDPTGVANAAISIAGQVTGYCPACVRPTTQCTDD